MKQFATRATLSAVVLLMAVWLGRAHAQAASSNLLPQVTIVWPRAGGTFSSEVLKIKANATDPDGSIAQVQFFAETNLIGVVTNSPFNVLWQVRLPGLACGPFNLKAVATDNLGAKTESTPVTLFYCGGPPPFPFVEIDSPGDQALYAAPATFLFSAEVLASLGDAGPVEFFIGTNSVGLVDGSTPLSANTPPVSITVSNLLEGEYKLTVRYRGQNGYYCLCNGITNTIRVVKLGVQSPSLTPDGRLQFEVVTSFPGKSNIIQASKNLADWFSIRTNVPPTNSFTFTESSPATNSQRFYRVIVPP